MKMKSSVHSLKSTPKKKELRRTYVFVLITPYKLLYHADTPSPTLIPGIAVSDEATNFTHRAWKAPCWGGERQASSIDKPKFIPITCRTPLPLFRAKENCHFATRNLRLSYYFSSGLVPQPVISWKIIVLSAAGNQQRLSRHTQLTRKAWRAKCGWNTQPVFGKEMWGE